MDLSDESRAGLPPEDVIFRLRAKMDDNTHTLLEDQGRTILAFRVEGEEIDLLASLEYLSEFIDEDSVVKADKLLIISDRRFELTPAEVLGPKMETKKDDDEKLFGELKGKLREKLDPIVFTVENDILELFRVAIRLEGSMNRTDTSIGLDLLKVDLPKEGDVIYLVFDDGYKKLSRSMYRSMVDGAMEGLREGPSLAKDPKGPSLERSTSVSNGSTIKAPAIKRKQTGEGPREMVTERKGNTDPSEPKLILRDFSKKIASLGYRKDTLFSRPDVNQMYFVGMRGPALLIKYMVPGEEPGSFLRILDHRKDSLGILITPDWQPDLEAVSRIKGFIYLDTTRASRASEVVSIILKEGGY